MGISDGLHVCGRAQGSNVRLIGFSQPKPVGQDGGFTCHAACGRHDACNGRYKFTGLPGEPGRVLYRWHCGESDRALGDRIARKGAANPAARHLLEEAKSIAVSSRKRPLVINSELEQALPGKAAQSSVAKIRRKIQADSAPPGLPGKEAAPSTASNSA